MSASIPVLELNLDAQGRVGPGRYFLLAGSGELKLLGKTFSTVSGELSPEGLMLEAQLNPDSEDWAIKGFALADFEMALRGRVGFGGPVPEVLLKGAGKFQIADVRVEGQCRVSANSDGWCLGASGRVNWQGRDWLQGAIELCNDRLSVQGQTHFALNLTPTQLPANIQIAGLVLTATVGGGFSVRSSGRLSSCNFDLDWTLAIQLPGSHTNQSLPIASQRLNVDVPTIPGNLSNVTLVDLINIDGLTLFELDGISIPVPTVSQTETADFYLHTEVSVNPPPTTMPFSLLTTSPGPSSDPNDPALIPGLYWYRPSLDLPSFDLPIPFLCDEPPDSNPGQDPLFSLPVIDTGEVPLSGGVRLDQLQLGLQLRWKNGNLGIWVVQTQQFIAFNSLPLFMPGILVTT